MADRIDVLRAASGERLALVGLGVNLPGCQNLEQYLQAIFKWSQPDGTQDSDWLINDALSRAAGEATTPLQSYHLEIGLLIIAPPGELDHLRKVFHFSGPILDYSGYAEPLPAMLAQSQEWLDNHTVDAVLLAGCQLEGEPEQRQAALGFDHSIHASVNGIGAVGISLMRLQAAQKKGIPVYAVVESLASLAATGLEIAAERMTACGIAALNAAELRPEEIGYLEALASGNDHYDVPEINGLVRIFQGQAVKTALGSGQSITGFMEGMNGLAALLHAATCLVFRIRPGVGNWNGPKIPDVWHLSSVYIPSETLTWFHPDGNRKCAVSLLGQDGTCGYLILSESKPRSIIEPLARFSGLYLIPIAAPAGVSVVDRLEALKERILSGEPLNTLAREAYLAHRSSPPSKVAVVLGRNSAEITREIEFALRGLPGAEERAGEWQTPNGSYYTSRPLGRSSQIAFVYPGAFNSYIGAGRDLFKLFPRIYDHVMEIAQDIGTTLRETWLYPRSMAPLSREQVERLEAGLLADPFSMILSGTSLSVILTSILRDVFHVRPDCSFGYSLGEDSLLFSMEVWGEGLSTSQRLFDNELFHTRLAGPQNAVREYWGLPSLRADEQGGRIWGNYLLMATPEDVRTAIKDEPRVYLTHINTPRQVVIGGDPAGCQRVIEQLKCSALKAPFDYVLHCKAMESEYRSLFEIHSLPVRKTPSIRLYSAADNRPFEMKPVEIARAVAHDLCSLLDFPRLVETVYADGAKIFIELGAGSNCAKWIEEILRGRPFLSISANRKGGDDTTSILRVLARLVSHQAQVNLEPLFQ